jgi:hypothetical protein
VPPGGMEQLAREIGYTAKYQVTLSCVPRLSPAELKRLRDSRRPFERVLDTGARSKDEYDDAIRGYEEHRVPVFFTHDCSVFVERPTDRFVEVYPPAAAAQVRELIASLESVFHEY